MSERILEPKAVHFRALLGDSQSRPYKFRLFLSLELLPSRTHTQSDETCPVLSPKNEGIYGGEPGAGDGGDRSRFIFV